MPPDEENIPQEVRQEEVEVPIPESKVEIAKQHIECAFCHEVWFDKCVICHRPFCKFHVAKSDLTLCYDCASDPTDSISFESKVEPLIDDEGVTHTGKRITPIGDTYVVTDYIANLSDEDLVKMLVEYQTKIKDAEKLLYSRIIVHNTIRGAVADRDHKKKMRDRAARVMKDATGAKTISLPGSSQLRQPKPQMSVKDSFAASAAGMTPEQKLELFNKLAVLKAALDAKNKTQ